MNNKTLILIPSGDARGGITNFYHTLLPFFPDNVVYQLRGSRTFPFRKNIYKEFIRILTDIFKFIFAILHHVSIVQTTTSLYPNAFKRDAIFLLIAKLFNKKTIVFFRGWDDGYSDKLKKSIFLNQIYLKSDAIIILTDKIKEKLLEWNYKGKIYHGTTLVDEKLVKELTEDQIKNKNNKINKNIKLLFLARLEKTKGVYELINTFELLVGKYPDIELIIAGDGLEEDNLKNYVLSKKLKNINFLGFVSNHDKIDAFNHSHLFVFPSYTEGMPNSVLEAMAFGLPVVTTAVGGLVDFFKNNVNGYMISGPDPQMFADKIERLLKDKELMLKISLNNYNYAKNNFMSSQVAKRNLDIFKEVLGNSNN